jgi:MmgE/PrpD C-terminal domain
VGAAGVTEFVDATVFRPDIVALRQKVRAMLDTSLPDGAARVIIQLTSGETFENLVMEAKGSLADPLSDRDVEAKVRDCARLGGTDWDLDRIIDGVWRLDTLADVASLMRVHG